MISTVYAALAALLIVWLSLRVIKLRRIKSIRLGDGDDAELKGAIRAQGNATEYLPISLILLFFLEFNGGHVALVHLGGIALLAGRISHARGLLTENLRYRIAGMQVTIFTLIGLAFADLGYVLSNAIRAHT
ncbi:MAPEG family protein [Methylococcus sp. EFPC2]|uniref:MAPEG family protein n=1 Tax=Methylococcus sp. EFPC2 TaxID=2812648 RepID=UPI001967D2FE|nr:MAPEG family protein [Methylococcus sp. EFPC2]QSA98149.1 MAPEG family protein [Methylococcus sp. EFPC2]